MFCRFCTFLFLIIEIYVEFMFVYLIGPTEMPFFLFFLCLNFIIIIEIEIIIIIVTEKIIRILVVLVYSSFGEFWLLTLFKISYKTVLFVDGQTSSTLKSLSSRPLVYNGSIHLKEYYLLCATTSYILII